MSWQRRRKQVQGNDSIVSHTSMFTEVKHSSGILEKAELVLAGRCQLSVLSRGTGRQLSAVLCCAVLC
jgi:hypothetical protein